MHHNSGVEEPSTEELPRRPAPEPRPRSPWVRLLPIPAIVLVFLALRLIHGGGSCGDDPQGLADLEAAARGVCDALGLRCAIGAMLGPERRPTLELQYASDAADPTAEAATLALEVHRARSGEHRARLLTIVVRPHGRHYPRYVFECRDGCRLVDLGAGSGTRDR